MNSFGILEEGAKHVESRVANFKSPLNIYKNGHQGVQVPVVIFPSVVTEKEVCTEKCSPPTPPHHTHTRKQLNTVTVCRTQTEPMFLRARVWSAVFRPVRALLYVMGQIPAT